MKKTVPKILSHTSNGKSSINKDKVKKLVEAYVEKYERKAWKHFELLINFKFFNIIEIRYFLILKLENFDAKSIVPCYIFCRRRNKIEIEETKF